VSWDYPPGYHHDGTHPSRDNEAIRVVIIPGLARLLTFESAPGNTGKTQNEEPEMNAKATKTIARIAATVATAAVLALGAQTAHAATAHAATLHTATAATVTTVDPASNPWD
jgi:hypothetical protein